jgi:ferredoxin
MTEKFPIVALCSCEGSMKLDTDAVERGCGGDLRTAHQLCRSELSQFRAMLGDGGDSGVTIGCTQEAPLFREEAAEAGFEGKLAFANVRETGGWSADAKAAGPKMAALLAAAAAPTPATLNVAMASGGIVLIYGRDETAIEAGRRLKDILDVTVILTKTDGVQPPRIGDFPVAKGRISAAKGHLGAFELTVDDFAMPMPSSRAELRFGPGRRGTSRCDLILDLSGGAPLFPAPELRQGYLRADPGNPADVARALFDAAQLEGEFDKPRFIRYTEHLCAHSRSQKTGCTRCLELCPAGAITPNGDHVAISAELCMGCGQCASVCPTGAAAYDFPPTATLLARLRAMLLAYRAAGGENPVVLFHDEEHGAALIDALARFGDGLPANVLPLQINEVTSAGLDAMAAAFAYGASALRFLLRAKPKHSTESLARNLGYAEAMLPALGFGKGLCATIETDDPDALGEALEEIGGARTLAAPAQFLPLGSGRGLLKQAVTELYAAAPAKVAEIPLPPRAPFGGLAINVEGCTLCLACVSACPTHALSDNPERPMLKFAEDLCVQCGLCQATCPERVISLQPRMNFEAWSKPPRIIKEEEPFCCISCGKPFGAKSAIERVTAKLEGRHWMFSGENARRISVLKMCDECRISAVVAESFDPHSGLERPAPRTTDDYLREAEAARKKDPRPQ